MSAASDESRKMELEPAPAEYAAPPRDRRRHIPEPPPVWLTAIDDVLAQASAGIEKVLDDFYVTMLRFERDRAPRDAIVYRAENLQLVFTIVEARIDRPDMRPIGIEVQSLLDAEMRIIDREFEYQRIKGLTAGSDQLMLQDPAGNWVSLTERRGVR